MIRIEKEIARHQRLLLAYHTYTLGLKTEHRQMDHPLNLFFLVLILALTQKQSGYMCTFLTPGLVLYIGAP